MPVKPILPVGQFAEIQNILNRYLDNAKSRNSPDAIKDIKLLMDGFNKTYPVYHKYMNGDLVEKSEVEK